MKNEAIRSSLENADRAVINSLKGTAPLFSAIMKASKAYREAGCEETAIAYETMFSALDILIESFDSANTAAVMAHKRLAGIEIPAPTQQDGPCCPSCGNSEDAPNNYDLCENCVEAMEDQDDEPMPAQTKPVSVVEQVFGRSPITAPVNGNDIPAWMAGHPVEMD